MTDLRKVWMAAALAAATVVTPVAHAQKPETNVMILRGGARSFLGVGVAEVTAQRAKDLKLQEERGVEVTRVEQGSPAEKAGIKVGDVVLEYQGQRIEGADQFIRLVRETPAGRTVKLALSRDGRMQNMTATLDVRKMQMAEGPQIQEMMEQREFRIPDMPRPMMGWRSSMLGVEAESLGPQLAEYFGVKEGVLVRSVAKDSAAQKAGIKAGDVIVKVGDEKVTSPMEVTNALRGERTSKDVSLTVVREKREMNLNVQVEPAKDTIRPRGRAVRYQ